MDVARLLLEKLLPLDLENFLKMTVFVHFVIDGLMDSNHIWKKNIFKLDGRILYRWWYSCSLNKINFKNFKFNLLLYISSPSYSHKIALLNSDNVYETASMKGSRKTHAVPSLRNNR
jgi:hypothetical protein